MQMSYIKRVGRTVSVLVKYILILAGACKGYAALRLFSVKRPAGGRSGPATGLLHVQHLKMNQKNGGPVFA
jgi:protein-tyrosine phosphatase